MGKINNISNENIRNRTLQNKIRNNFFGVNGNENGTNFFVK
jgi:hypothetical protein